MFKKGDIIRFKQGCVWIYGEIADDTGDDWYEVYYGTKKDYERGFGFPYFADIHKSRLILNDNKTKTEDEKLAQTQC